MAGPAKKTGASSAAAATPRKPTKRAARLNQADVPAYTLAEAIKVPEALRDDFANKSAAPLDLAASLLMSPNSSGYRMLTSAANAYGLIEGSAQTPVVTLTELGRRVVAPTEEGDEAVAMREAALKPRVIREFLEKYNGNLMPQKVIAMNVIETMSVPKDATERAYDMILNNAEALGLLLDTKGKKYVKLDAPAAAEAPAIEQDLHPKGEPGFEISETASALDGGSYSLKECARYSPQTTN